MHREWIRNAQGMDTLFYWWMKNLGDHYLNRENISCHYPTNRMRSKAGIEVKDICC